MIFAVFRLDPRAAEFGRRRRILCVSRKSAEKNSAKPYGKRRLSRREICRLRVSYTSQHSAKLSTLFIDIKLVNFRWNISDWTAP